MSPKCIKISSCACVIIFSGVLFGLAFRGGLSETKFRYQPKTSEIRRTLILSNSVQCSLDEMPRGTLKSKTPSLKSFIQASTAMEELRLSGLAVFLKLANACQPLADVSKANIQANKIALISLGNEPVCPLQDLVGHAQNAGYSVVVIFSDDLYRYRDCFHQETTLQDKLLIPVLSVDRTFGCYSGNNSLLRNIKDSVLLAADRTNIEMEITEYIATDDLKRMQEYLRRLYYWFLLGPVIAIEWLRRRKKLSFMSGSHVSPETAVESELNRVADHEVTRGETMPLLLDSNVPRNGHSRPIAIRRILTYLRGSKLAVGCGYVILIVVALPVGISGGGWSFFRFDENEIQQKSFWDDLNITSRFSNDPIETFLTLVVFNYFLPLWWPPLQIFCFFLYSRFACKTTWTVPTNYSKLIRSDWFASNMYLLILGIVVPYCSSVEPLVWSSIYFMSYNTV